MHLLIVGDSHTGALERGRASLEARGALPADVALRIVPLGTGARMNRPFWRPAGARAAITDAGYRAHLPALPPDGPRPDAIGLSMPLWTGRVIRALIASDVMPYGIDGPGRPISRALLRRLVQGDQQHTLALARFLAGQGHRVFVIEPPGLIRDNRFLLQLGPEALLALWAEIRAQMRAAVTEAGLPVLDAPAATVDEDGFTRSAFRHEDPTDRHHANAAFGALMVSRALDLARDLCAAPVPEARR